MKGRFNDVALVARVGLRSSNDRLHDLALYVGEAVVPPGVPVCQLRVVESEKVQNGGVQVVHRGDVLDRVVSELVGRTIALMQFFKPENYFTVREALIKAGRADLIGGCEGLIPNEPPKEALEARRRQANNAVKGDHYHTVANPAKGEEPGERGAEPPKTTGYRPGRKSAQRRKNGKSKRNGGSEPRP